MYVHTSQVPAPSSQEVILTLSISLSIRKHLPTAGKQRLKHTRVNKLSSMDSISQRDKLPLVDFNELGGDKPNPESPEWACLRAQVRLALEEFGCFEARFDGVPLDLRNAMLGSLQELFDLPLEMKLRNVSRKPFHGYVGQYPQVPLYESMGIDDADVHEKVEEIARSLWPQGHPSFRFGKKQRPEVCVRLFLSYSFITENDLCRSDAVGLLMDICFRFSFPWQQDYTVLFGEAVHAGPDRQEDDPGESRPGKVSGQTPELDELPSSCHEIQGTEDLRYEAGTQCAHRQEHSDHSIPERG